MNILDIFYKEIIMEAKDGVIKSFFNYNILFATHIYEDNLYIKGNMKYEGVITPVLEIKNKKLFNELLINYVNSAKNFYQDSKYLKEIEDNSNESIEKVIISLLFSNACFEDFQNPIEFLKRRIAFFNLDINEELNTNFLDYDLNIKISKDEIYNETPYMMEFFITDGLDFYQLPKIKFGLYNNSVYVYAIQSEILEENKLSKKLNRLFYKVNSTLSDIDLKDITPSFLISANILINYLNNYNYHDYVISSILLPRWNAKSISNEKRLNNNYIDIEKYKELVSKQNLIQSNITDKFLRTFYRLISHYEGIVVTSNPMDIDSNLHFEVNRDLICDNNLLNEFNKSLDIKRKVI